MPEPDHLLRKHGPTERVGDSDPRPHKLLGELQRLRVQHLAGARVVDLEGGAVLPVLRLVNAVAPEAQRSVHRDLPGGDLPAPAGHTHGAAEVQRLTLIAKAGAGIVHDDLDLLPLPGSGEQRPALALSQPKLKLLAAEFRDHRAGHQQDQRKVHHERRELRPLIAVREEVDRAVALLALDLEAVPAQRRGDDARIRRRSEVIAMPRPLEVGVGDAALRLQHGAPDRREATDRAGGDGEGEDRHQPVPVRLIEEVEDAPARVIEPGELGQDVGERPPRPALQVDMFPDLDGVIAELRRHLGDDHRGQRQRHQKEDQHDGGTHRGELAPEEIERIGKFRPPSNLRL